MNITIENKKQKAIELMNRLDIYKPYIKGFKDKNSVCFYENFGGFWAYQEPELMAKIKAFEEQYNVLVYAVTHEYTEFMYCPDKKLITFAVTKQGRISVLDYQVFEDERGHYIEYGNTYEKIYIDETEACK